MQYENYSFIKPPRAETAIPTSTLKFYEKKGLLAQTKMNGTNTVIFIPPNGEIFAKTRHGEDHKLWDQQASKSLKHFEKLRTSRWSVYNAELMHSKIVGLRDTHYVHDVLVYDGNLLNGSEYLDRYELLTRLFRGRDETTSHVVIEPDLWLAKNHFKGFRKLFDGLGPTDEGLVLKDPEGKLCLRDNSSWSVKCRRPMANFGF
jgi:hypothetical protein